MSEPTPDELAVIGKEALGKSLKYDRGEVKLAQDVAIKQAEIERLRALCREAYESLLGDTDHSAWHSEHCYRTLAYNGKGCVCGLKNTLKILRGIAHKR